ncbi:rhodanese-like domain-containing protein [Mangrovimonas aestuarii]|uniref:rhodanese-like domain-containing protein n=1 Tax=Mangrovimonas aestuarii TaxID=3018443 RepID=UPI002378EA81|nr:rhodanese-like domain-containing protein [Mangrovimonas aestuarii]
MENTQSKFHSSNEVIEQIKVSQLDKIIESKQYTIVDVRSPQAIENQGNIPEAINIPLEEVKTQIDKRHEDLKSIFNGNGPFLFCCTGGVMSYMAAIHAQKNDVKGVFNLEGGHSAWLKLKKS